MTMNIRVYFNTEDQLDKLVDCILLNQPQAKVSTWEPDGDGVISHGTWGAFVDNIEENWVEAFRTMNIDLEAEE